jgi:hypothetical protein
MNLESLTKEQLIKETKAIKKRNEELQSENASVRRELYDCKRELEEQQKTDLAKLGKHLDRFRDMHRYWELMEKYDELLQGRDEWAKPYEERIRELERALADQCVRNMK